jgi:hypothetical protein
VLDQGSLEIPRMDSSPLKTLPPELVFRILDLMSPFQYSGFSCVCRRALSLVNQRLDTPKHRKLTSLESRKSRTAAFVTIQRLFMDGKLAPVDDKLSSEDVCICYGPILMRMTPIFERLDQDTDVISIEGPPGKMEPRPLGPLDCCHRN